MSDGSNGGRTSEVEPLPPQGGTMYHFYQPAPSSPRENPVLRLATFVLVGLHYCFSIGDPLGFAAEVKRSNKDEFSAAPPHGSVLQPPDAESKHSKSSSTFYVDNQTGDDRNDGRTASTAWKSLKHVNEGPFSPGTKILLRRGQVWHETLTVPSSGTAKALLRIGAFGEGKNPVINRADPYDDWWEHSLVINSSFERFSGKIDDRETDEFHAWGVLIEGESRAFAVSDSATGHVAVKLVRKGVSPWLHYTLDLRANRSYFIELLGRTEGDGIGEVMLKDIGSGEYFSDGEWGKPGPLTELEVRSKKWATRQTVIQTGNRSRKVQFRYFAKRATAYLDGVYIVEGDHRREKRVWAGYIPGVMNTHGAVLNGRRIPRHVRFPHVDPIETKIHYFNAPGNGYVFYYYNNAGKPDLQIGVRPYAILIDGKSYILIDGIDTTGPAGTPDSRKLGEFGLTLFTIRNSKKILVRNCKIRNSHTHGILAENSTDVRFLRLVATGCKSTGIYNNATHGYIKQCRSFGNGRLVTDSGDRGGLGVFRGSHLTIEGNEVFGNGRDDSDADFEISIVGCPGPIAIMNNYVHDAFQGGIQIAEGGDESVIRDNIIVGYAGSGFTGRVSNGKFAAIRIGGGNRGARNVKVRNNWISGGTSPRSSSHAGLYVVHDSSGLEVLANVFLNNRGPDIVIAPRANSDRDIFRDNVYAKSNLTANWNWKDHTLDTYESWRKVSGAENPIQSDVSANKKRLDERLKKWKSSR